MVENRKGCVLGTRRCDPASLAQIVHCVVRHGRHDVQDLARMVRRQGAALYRQTDGVSEDLTIGQAVAISELQRDSRIVEEMCRRVGGVFVALSAHDVTDDCIREALMEAVREIGEDSGLVSRVLAQPEVTEQAADAVDREVDETVAWLFQVKARVRAKVAGSRGALREVAR